MESFEGEESFLPYGLFGHVIEFVQRVLELNGLFCFLFFFFLGG